MGFFQVCLESEGLWSVQQCGAGMRKRAVKGLGGSQSYPHTYEHLVQDRSGISNPGGELLFFSFKTDRVRPIGSLYQSWHTQERKRVFIIEAIECTELVTQVMKTASRGQRCSRAWPPWEE